MFYLERARLPGQTSDKPESIDWAARFDELAAGCKNPLLGDYYAAGAVSAQTPMAEVPLVAMDFETTGLDPRCNGIVSIGLVPFELSRIRCRDAQQWLLKLRMQLTEESITIHGITHSEVAEAPDLEEVLEPLLHALRGRVLVAHYGAIERDFLTVALMARIGEGIAMPLIDTMALEARLHRQPGWWGRFLGRQAVSIRLAQSRSRYNLPHYRPHHALTDALACGELLIAQVAHHFGADTPVSELWS